MSLPNTTLWDSLLPGGTGSDTADGGIDTTQVIDGILWTLHAGSRADLVFWTEADLIQWMDEAVKRLSRVACVFVGRDTNILSIISQATYTLPVRHISTLHVSYSIAPLRPAGTMELEGLDTGWQTTTGTPARWYEDQQGDATLGLCPVPDTSDVVIPVIYAGYPDELDTGRQNTLISAPPPLKGYLAMCVLKAAYEREGEMECQDIAQHCKGRMDLFESIVKAYYGAGI